MPTPIKKKAPNPKAHWKEKAEKLQAKDTVLFKRIVGFHFQHWEPSSIRESKILADEAVKLLGNEYSYAQSTYLSGLRTACVDIERAKPVGQRPHNAKQDPPTTGACSAFWRYTRSKDMKRGHSGAIITITTRGVVKCSDPDKGLLEQAAMCDKLYPVTPRIYNTHKSPRTEHYTMEELKEPIFETAHATAWACATMKRLRRTLEANVWNQKADNDTFDAGWRSSLVRWLSAFGVDLQMYAQLIEELFCRRSPAGTYSLIHGDPTLANVLFREAVLVIVDPIPPKGKIPSHFTVDLGKMLQSAMGWETISFGWRYDTETVGLEVLTSYDMLTRARAWFWASIHCLRLLPYARDPQITEWAKENAARCLEHSWRTSCCMPSTLTEHSSILVKRSSTPTEMLGSALQKTSSSGPGVSGSATRLFTSRKT